MPALNHELAAKAAQVASLTPQARMGLRMLAMNLPDLRAELLREMSSNPVIEEVEPTLEKTVVSDRERQDDLALRGSDYPDDGEGFENSFEEGFYRNDDGSSGYSATPEAMDRRRHFLESLTREETLEEHLLSQLSFSDIAEGDRPLAEMLIGDIDGDGMFAGSIPDIMMVTGESEKHIRSVLAKITQLDPLGCGASSARECLLAQLEKLNASAYREDVRKLIENHLADIAAGRTAQITSALGIDEKRYFAALKELRTLDPRPGRGFAYGGRRVEFVNPEVHVKRDGDGWSADVDDRSLPEIRISRKYLEMLNNPELDRETREYVRSRIAAAEAVRSAVENRQETIRSIAQAIVDAQPDFFREGLKGLKPLTMEAVAKKVGVHPATVSRTVRDKYASTPKGVVELRRFFTSGYTGENGESVSRDTVQEKIRVLIAGEERSRPYSDDRISELLKAEGLSVARRTVAKYRAILGIPGASERKVR